MRRIGVTETGADERRILAVFENVEDRLDICSHAWRGEHHWESVARGRYYVGGGRGSGGRRWNCMVVFDDDTFGTVQSSAIDDMLAHHRLRRVA